MRRLIAALAGLLLALNASATMITGAVVTKYKTDPEHPTWITAASAECYAYNNAPATDYLYIWFWGQECIFKKTQLIIPYDKVFPIQNSNILSENFRQDATLDPLNASDGYWECVPYPNWWVSNTIIVFRTPLGGGGNYTIQRNSAFQPWFCFCDT